MTTALKRVIGRRRHSIYSLIPGLLIVMSSASVPGRNIFIRRSSKKRLSFATWSSCQRRSTSCATA
jgi:hypothetical protein